MSECDKEDQKRDYVKNAIRIPKRNKMDSRHILSFKGFNFIEVRIFFSRENSRLKLCQKVLISNFFMGGFLYWFIAYIDVFCHCFLIQQHCQIVNTLECCQIHTRVAKIDLHSDTAHLVGFSK